MGFFGFVDKLFGCNPRVELAEHLVGGAVVFCELVDVDVLSAHCYGTSGDGGI